MPAHFHIACPALQPLPYSRAALRYIFTVRDGVGCSDTLAARFPNSPLTPAPKARLFAEVCGCADTSGRGELEEAAARFLSPAVLCGEPKARVENSSSLPSVLPPSTRVDRPSRGPGSNAGAEEDALTGPLVVRGRRRQGEGAGIAAICCRGTGERRKVSEGTLGQELWILRGFALARGDIDRECQVDENSASSPLAPLTGTAINSLHGVMTCRETDGPEIPTHMHSGSSHAPHHDCSPRSINFLPPVFPGAVATTWPPEMRADESTVTCTPCPHLGTRLVLLISLLTLRDSVVSGDPAGVLGDRRQDVHFLPAVVSEDRPRPHGLCAECRRHPRCRPACGRRASSTGGCARQHRRS